MDVLSDKPFGISDKTAAKRTPINPPAREQILSEQTDIGDLRVKDQYARNRPSRVSAEFLRRIDADKDAEVSEQA